MLTDIAIKKLKPATTRREVHDGHGLYVIIQPTGHKSFAYRYRFGGEPKKYTIGRAQIGLKAARAEASRAALEVAQGRDPAARKREDKAQQRREVLATEDSFRKVCERFLKLEGGKIRSAERFRRTLELMVYKELGSRPITDIKRSDIVRLLDHIEQNRGPASAHSGLSLIRRIMGWHAARSDDFRSPVVRGMGRVNAKERVRSRVLTDDEIRRLWTAAEQTEGPFGRIVQILLFTAARRTEVSQMRWRELSAEGDWLLPPERNKVKVPLLRPLSAAARKVIAETPKVSDEYVFSVDGKRPLANCSRPKGKLDAMSGVTGWRLHDLRRTARSLMARAGVQGEHAERCLGHVLPGIVGTYNKHSYHAEKKHAFELLAAEIARIVNPPPKGKVIPMARGA